MHPRTAQYLQSILFLDIETATIAPTFAQLTAPMQVFWQQKATLFPTLTPAEAFEQEAALYAEFAKIICIGVGLLVFDDAEQTPTLRVKAFSAQDEPSLLHTFQTLLENRQLKNRQRLVAHNGKEFDYPFLCRRMLINGFPLPPALQGLKAKPWENPHLDTMEMWRFGDRRNFTSLPLLAHLLNVPATPDSLDSKKISSLYHQGEPLSNIEAHCRHHVALTAQVFLALNQLPVLELSQIVEA